jgi:hypothetical protein
LVAGVADGLTGAALYTLAAKSQLLWRGRLPGDISNTALVIAAEVVGSGLAAQVAIEALVVHEELAGHVEWNVVLYLGAGSGTWLRHWFSWLPFSRDARHRLTTPSSATGGAGAAPAGGRKGGGGLPQVP